MNKENIKYFIGMAVGIGIFVFGILFAKKQFKKNYIRPPKREYLV